MNRKSFVVVALVASISLMCICVGFSAIISRTSNDDNVLTKTEYDSDVDTIYGEFNGNINEANIKDSAVTTSKLGTDAVVPSKVDEDNDNPFVMQGITVSTGTISDITVTTVTASGGVNTNIVFLSPISVSTITTNSNKSEIVFSTTIAISSITAISPASEIYLTTNTVLTRGATIFWNDLKLLRTFVNNASSTTLITHVEDQYIFRTGQAGDTFTIGADGTSETRTIALMPFGDNTPGQDLGSVAHTWRSLFYGSGGLNEDTSFKDKKKNIIFYDAEYDTLPRWGEYNWKKEKDTDKKHKRFIIDDTQENFADYKYVSDDGETMELGSIVAQISQCVRDLNDRVNLLENQIIDLNTRIAILETP